jgi:hypothetical protein
MKSSSLAYNRCDTQGKRSLGREPGRSRYHLHTSEKILVAAQCFMDIGGTIRMCCRSVHGSMGCDLESFTLVWR